MTLPSVSNVGSRSPSAAATGAASPTITISTAMRTQSKARLVVAVITHLLWPLRAGRSTALLRALVSARPWKERAIERGKCVDGGCRAAFRGFRGPDRGGDRY